MNDVFNIKVMMYVSLVKYKDEFANAIKIYSDHAIGMYACDYAPLEEKKISVRLKIEYSSAYYEELLKMIEQSELEILKQKGDLKTKKINKTVLVNNIMSTLLGIKQYNY